MSRSTKDLIFSLIGLAGLVAGVAILYFEIVPPLLGVVLYLVGLILSTGSMAKFALRKQIEREVFAEAEASDAESPYLLSVVYLWGKHGVNPVTISKVVNKLEDDPTRGEILQDYAEIYPQMELKVSAMKTGGEPVSNARRSRKVGA